MNEIGFSAEDMVKIAIRIIFFALVIAMVSGVIGYSIGYDKAYEDIKKNRCVMEFSNTPYEKINGNCLKYFRK